MDFWRGKRVLVTGGAGFVGSYLTELLVRRGARVTVADDLSRTDGDASRLAAVRGKVRLLRLDLRRPSACRTACRGQQVVLNLAAKVTGIEYNRFHMAEMFEANMLLQMNVLHAAHACGVRRFLQVSTACIYPHDAKVPTPETEGERGSPEPTNEGYGLAKRMGEKLALYYAAEKAMDVVIARPFNAYGPRDHYDEGSSHVVPALIRRVLEGQDPVVIWGTGRQSRVFVHARDLAMGLLLVAEKAPRGTIVNVGHNREVTIRQLFVMICRVLRRRPKAHYDTSKPDGYPRRAADTRLLRRLTGFVPSVPLERGIREMAVELSGSDIGRSGQSSRRRNR